MAHIQIQTRKIKMKGTKNVKQLLFEKLVTRDDVYAVQNSNGSYHTVQSPLTTDIYLSDETTVGTYLLDQNGNVLFICIDIDVNKDALETADGDITQFEFILQKQALQIQDIC